VKGGETDAVADSLIRARAGDRLAFASLVRRYQRLVYSLALRMLSDGHEAEDLAQEVFMQLHRRLDRIESDAHLLFWLRKVTTNLAIDRLRQERKAAILPLDEDPGIADEARAISAAAAEIARARRAPAGSGACGRASAIPGGHGSHGDR